jgi:hypothetical protein
MNAIAIYVILLYIQIINCDFKNCNKINDHHSLQKIEDFMVYLGALTYVFPRFENTRQ